MPRVIDHAEWTTIEAGPDESVAAVTARFGDRPGTTVLVVEDGRLVGVIEPRDLARIFRSG